MNPKSVAIVGASGDSNRIGGKPLVYLKESGFAGDIYLVNPKYDQLHGVKCYPSLSSIASRVDVVLLAVPASAVPAIVSETAGLDIGMLVVYAAGFRESGAAGTALEETVMREARKSGVRVLGPNCLGLANLHNGFIGSFSSAFEGAAHTPGVVGFVSQSGAFGSMILTEAANQGIHFSSFINTGNAADLTISDALESLLRDDHTRVILGYMEGVTDGSRLLDTLRAAKDVNKPVIVLKAGRSRAGAAAAASHTGAMAGADDVYSAALSDTGAIRATSMDHMLDLAQVLGAERRTEGNRLGIVTLSGGAGVLMADEAEDAGLDVSEFSQTLQSQLSAAIPAFGSSVNPVDFTAQLINEPYRLGQCLDIVVASEAVDMVAIFLGNQGTIEDDLIDTIVGSYARTNKPVVVTWVGGSGNARLKLRGRGVPAFSDPSRCIIALGDLYRYSSRLREIEAEESPLTDSPRVFETASLWNSVGVARNLTEPEARELVGAYGIECVPAIFIPAAGRPEDSSIDFGAPYSLKIVSSDITHKSDVGGVQLGLMSVSEVDRSHVEMIAGVRQALPDANLDGTLVSPMVFGELEIIVGGKVDPVFGPVVMVGAGGVLAEELRDSAVRLAPIDHKEAKKLLEELQISRLFGRVRGRGPLDVEALVSLVSKVSHLVWLEQGRIESLDLNPVLLRQLGEGAMPVDVKVIVHQPGTPDPGSVD